MKKFVALVLLLMMIGCFTATAFAGYWVVLEDPDSYLRLRSGPSTSDVIIAYLKDRTVVNVLQALPDVGFYKIEGTSYLNHSDWTGEAVRKGYASMDYIKKF